MAFLRNLFTILFAGAGICLWQLASDFDAHKFEFPAPPSLIGPLLPNKDLRNAKLLVKDKVLGPESLLVEGETIYTGTWDGKLLKIVNGQIQKTIYLNKVNLECGTYDTEPKCGRPLGLRRLNKQLLVVVDTYHGIYTVDFEKGITKQIFSAKTKVGSYESKFLNDVEVIDEDTLLVTDSSTNFDRRRFLHVVLENAPVGRLMEIKILSGKARVLLGGLHFANGVQLHPDKQSVIVAECSMAKLLRYYFAGPRTGEAEVFASNLPGFPDNVRLSKQGTFYVGVALVRHSGKFSLIDALGPLPWLRKLVASSVPEKYLATLFSLVKTHYGMILEFDTVGKIIRSYQDPDGSVIQDVSQISDDQHYMYLGSFHSKFIARVPKKN